MDYISNIISLDPDNLIKFPNKLTFKKKDNQIIGNLKNNNFNLKFNYDLTINSKFKKLSSDLIKKSDYIFYNYGIYDKLYYDSSLINNKIIDLKKFNVKFTFFDLELTDIHSIFYFKEDINFVGGMWENIFD